MRVSVSSARETILLRAPKWTTFKRTIFRLHHFTSSIFFIFCSFHCHTRYPPSHYHWHSHIRMAGNRNLEWFIKLKWFIKVGRSSVCWCVFAISLISRILNNLSYRKAFIITACNAKQFWCGRFAIKFKTRVYLGFFFLFHPFNSVLCSVRTTAFYLIIFFE